MMNNALRAAAFAAAMTLAAGTTASAQAISEGFTYQGVLRDGGGLANGAYDLEFRVFDAVMGGSQVSPNLILPNQAVTDGLVTQLLEFGPGIFDGTRRWLEIRVRPVGAGVFTTLPRQEIRATPNAVFAKSSEVSGFAMTSGTTLQDAFDNGPAIDASGGMLQLSDASMGSFVDVLLNDGNFNDGLRLLNSDGETFFNIAEDVSGGGGFLSVTNGFGSEGFFVDGNSFGTDFTRVVIDGVSTIRFDTSETGDAAVDLPNNTVSAPELADEAGLAFASQGFGPTLTNAIAVIDSRTINPPTDGHVIAIATVQLFVDHVGGTDTSVNFYLSPVSASTVSSSQVRIEIDGSVGSDSSLSRSVTMHDVFEVSGGTPFSIFLNGTTTGGGTSTDADDTQLTLLFVPTAYGTVQREPGDAGRFGGVEPGPLAASRPALTPADFAAEREASIAANLARMEAEMAQMRAEIDAMRAERANARGPEAGKDR